MALQQLDNLYRQTVMAYAQQPHHFHPVTPDDPCQVTKLNPTCGDVIHLAVTVADGRVKAMHFDGDGCAISMASASIMTDLMIGQTVGSALALAATFSKMTMGEAKDLSSLGEAKLLAGVVKFPARIKCATLAWHALTALLTETEEV
ncbi:Fe-S cluster assembly sulfur transfer protein SufU [Leuconostoc holzapfelii]|uniref:SUF system NifU family Fe-S cluster assembly protein n=1 Tax=Leuconostoc holzapfelii TaxID=434464 RepID=A0A846ZDD7_9LACO|nr:SUF system NifU family Fe-S cluster assembly protein [Leuconostoc holzapfelii]NKZ18014.1 SUF system NifU family Fe-S cluster assembly protein [Leuconostoc holzapfelii]